MNEGEQVENNEGFNMLAIQKYEAEIVEGKKITEELCLEIIALGEGIKGYGLYLAKEKLHEGSQVGWEKFCIKAGMTVQDADRQIAFYKAKSEPKGSDFLPDRERQFRALEGKTVEAKVEAYDYTKKVTGKANPNAAEIELVKKARKYYVTSIEKQEELINIVVDKASPKVRAEVNKALGKRGVKKAIEMIDSGADDSDIIEELNSEALDNVKFTKKEKAIANKSTSEKIEKLRSENEKLRARVLELEKLDEVHERMGTFVSFTTRLQTVMMQARALKSESKKALLKMKPEIKDALLLLGLEVETAKVDYALLKKAYRKKAKEHHPDLGGDEDFFILIKEAYDKLKSFYEGLGV